MFGQNPSLGTLSPARTGSASMELAEVAALNGNIVRPLPFGPPPSMMILLLQANSQTLLDSSQLHAKQPYSGSSNCSRSMTVPIEELCHM